MERPDLQRLLEAVENHRVNLVITKDLSRLGRNHLETGNLIEIFFPRHGVRYIALNDGVDTLYDNNDIAPFKNLLNEFYSRDISKKIHSSYYLKAKQGQYTGTVAPFGYRKDPENKNHLLIDEETAPFARQIFEYAMEGRGPNYIRQRLEQDKVPCPTWWNRQRGLRNTTTRWEKKDPENGRFIWDFSIIRDILINPVYYGAIASQKLNYRFKVGVINAKKPDEWIIVEGMHEPIISREEFKIVQDKLKSRQRPRKGNNGETGEFSLFAGLLKCGECGKALTIRMTHAKHPRQVYACKTYNSYGKNHCTQHQIDADTLYDLVLNKIRECARAALRDDSTIAGRLANSCSTEQQEQRDALEKAISKDTSRLKVLEKMVQKLYEDMATERISESNFDLMLNKTQTEQDEINARIAENRKRLDDSLQLANETKRWLDIIREYADITELDPALLNRLIKQIIVHETVDEDKTRHISVEIHFNLKPLPETVNPTF